MKDIHFQFAHTIVGLDNRRIQVGNNIHLDTKHLGNLYYESFEVKSEAKFVKSNPFWFRDICLL